MPANQDTAGTFTDIINKHNTPPSVTNNAGGEPPGLFADASKSVFEKREDGTGFKYKYEVKRRIFLVYRPYISCERCRVALENKEIAFPPNGELQCGHTDVEEYEAIVNACLRGDMLHGGEREVDGKDGSVRVSLRWYVKVEDTKKRSPLARAPFDGDPDSPDL